MIEGVPSGTVISRWTDFPPCRISRIWALLAPAGISNSPALIGSDPPRIFARFRKVSADLITPSDSIASAAMARLEPDLMMIVRCFSSGPLAFQP